VRRARWLQALLLCAIVAASGGVADAAAQTRDRCATACTYVFVVGSQPRDWHTPWVAEVDDTVALVVTVSGQELTLRRLGACAMTFRGHGVSVRAHCATNSVGPVTLRLTAYNGHPSRVGVWIKRLGAGAGAAARHAASPSREAG
jgi:hypothetical protein